MRHFRPYHEDPNMMRISSRLYQMSHQHFNDKLYFTEPGHDSLAYPNDYVFGWQCHCMEVLCDKIAAKVLLLHEDEMVQELVRVITPWYEKVKDKCKCKGRKKLSQNTKKMLENNKKQLSLEENI